MPLLSRRRSTLDVLLNDARSDPRDDDDDDGSIPPVSNPSLGPSLPALPAMQPEPRPVSAQPALSPFLRDPPSPPPPSQAPPSPPIQDATPAINRFSMLRWRHFSDGQLSAKARLQAEHNGTPPPVPSIPSLPSMPQMPAPQIITTSPTMDEHTLHSHHQKTRRGPFKRHMSRLSPAKAIARDSTEDNKDRPWRKTRSTEIDRLGAVSTPPPPPPPPPPLYGDESNTALALPISRLSDSSGGDRSSGEHVTYATTTTTHTISTTTTLFKLPRRNKQKHLFPLPVKSQPTPSQSPERNSSAIASPRPSTSAVSTRSNIESPNRKTPPPFSALNRRHTEVSRPRLLPVLSTSPTPVTLAKSSAPSLADQGGPPLFRNDSNISTHSALSSSVLAPPKRFGLRDRSSTLSSYGRPSDDMSPPTPPMLGSARNSTSTSGRTSLGGLLGLNRFRHNSDAQSRQALPGTHSKSNSLSISPEVLVIPVREEGDTPGKYLDRLQAAVSRSLIAGILSKSADPFAQAVLRSYCRKFSFFGEPIDMSLRKFLLEAELPKETQQVDRVIQAFADRYHECNPGIFMSPDQAYIIAFSLMMLHTDAFNKNNKRKMQKHDYIKNTSGQHVSDDVLACFYDNICYTPFIHFEEEVDINGERLLTFKPKKSKLRGNMPEPGKKNTGPIDPYALICDGKLDTLRPAFKDSITMEDPYNYLGTAKSFDMQKLQRSFVNTGVLQIISARSRPAAFESQATRDNPGDSAIGLVDLKITKVGILWRKSTKRKKTRSPWQEWGAVLTGSQLYLFKNVAWVKGLMSQQYTHVKQEGLAGPVIFKPPVHDFKPDALIKTDDAVALLDSSYNKHKDAFTLVRHGGQEEILIAENESEVNEWIALINYAAAFRSAGVRIRGFIGGTDTDVAVTSRGRLNSMASINSTLNSTMTSDGEVTVEKRTLTPYIVRQVLAARRQIMSQTIVESDRELADATRNLESMLRNARHLQILAPVQPKTREEVIHAAARMDANLKWIRRDIWRTKCHRDILSLDLQEDGDMFENKLPARTPTVRRTTDLQMTHSKNSSVVSPPTSPQSSVHPAQPDADGPPDGFFSSDVFKTPPEHALRFGEAWNMPNVDLGTPSPQSQPQGQRRVSVASVPQSAFRKHSTAGLSAASSAHDADRQLSSAASDTPSHPGHMTPTRSYDDQDREAILLARDGLVPTTTATTGSSVGSPTVLNATPESASKIKSGRRSLHRTLREVGHQPSIHRHRKGKESASTARSEGSRPEDIALDTTPGLERKTKKFIVHGKQASVVTFGADWSEDKMRMPRELGARRRSIVSIEDGEEESGPEANLRYHVAREMSATSGREATASENTPTQKSSEFNVNDPVVMNHWSNDTDDRISTATETIQQADAYNLHAGGLTSNADSSDEEAETYFDATPRSSGASRTLRLCGPGPNSELAQDNVAPEDLPLPASPPSTTQDDNDPPKFFKHIDDEKLRQLSFH